MNCDLHEENSFDWLCSPETLDSWASFRSEPLSPNKRAYGTWPTPAFRPITPIHEFPLNTMTSGVALINQRDLLYDSDTLLVKRRRREATEPREITNSPSPLFFEEVFSTSSSYRGQLLIDEERYSPDITEFKSDHSSSLDKFEQSVESLDSASYSSPDEANDEDLERSASPMKKNKSKHRSSKHRTNDRDFTLSEVRSQQRGGSNESSSRKIARTKSKKREESSSSTLSSTSPPRSSHAKQNFNLRIEVEKTIIRLQLKHSAPVNVGRLWGNFNKRSFRFSFDEVLQELIETARYEVVNHNGKCIHCVDDESIRNFQAEEAKILPDAKRKAARV